MVGSIHGGQFVPFINSVYGTAEDMAVAAQIATAGVPRSQLHFGSYEKTVVPHRGLWPQVTSPNGNVVSTYDTYKRGVDQARASLSAAPNTDPLSPDEPTNIPRTRLDLLDEALQKAFYTSPPIPIEFDCQDGQGQVHEVKVAWDVDASGKPIKLRWTIYCPVVP